VLCFALPARSWYPFESSQPYTRIYRRKNGIKRSKLAFQMFLKSFKLKSHGTIDFAATNFDSF
jgi:hypothetical protein